MVCNRLTGAKIYSGLEYGLAVFCIRPERGRFCGDDGERWADTLSGLLYKSSDGCSKNQEGRRDRFNPTASFFNSLNSANEHALSTAPYTLR